MDKRRFNRGTPGNKGGRKPKSDEIRLIEKLDQHIDEDAVYQVLYELVLKGNIKAIQIYMNYRHGKPKEIVQMNVVNETPILALHD